MEMRCAECKHYKALNRRTKWVDRELIDRKYGTCKKIKSMAVHMSSIDDDMAFLKLSRESLAVGPDFSCAFFKPDAYQTLPHLKKEDIARIMAEQSISQSGLARATGYSRQSVSDWIHGRRNVSKKAVLKLKSRGFLDA